MGDCARAAFRRLPALGLFALGVGSGCHPLVSSGPTGSRGIVRRTLDACFHPSPAPGLDADHDGLDDACESALAETYAPVVVYSSAEPNLPTTVDAFLAETVLAFRDDACPSSDVVVARAPLQEGLLQREGRSPCHPSVFRSDGSRSLRKHRTFFLADVSPADRRGSPDSRAWRTYVHAYPNDLGGVTLQYWRFYAFNEAGTSHGGDWEAAHVVLQRDGTVERVRLLGHASIDERAPGELGWEGTHPVVYAEVGAHTSRPTGDDIRADGCGPFGTCELALDEPRSFIRDESWTGGKVTWPDGHESAGGGLLGVGEKSTPLNGQSFVRYSGLWGSPGRFYFTSGYWGPAYNETSLRQDGFETAWCEGMAGPLDRKKECWPAAVEP